MATLEEISKFKDLEYQQFLEVLIEEAILFCKDNQILLSDLISHLEDSEVGQDLKTVLSKIRDSKINSIINERS
jgi:hypothetical protein